jgi:hypothetical protein
VFEPIATVITPSGAIMLMPFDSVPMATDYTVISIVWKQVVYI